MRSKKEERSLRWPLATRMVKADTPHLSYGDEATIKWKKRRRRKGRRQ